MTAITNFILSSRRIWRARPSPEVAGERRPVECLFGDKALTGGTFRSRSRTVEWPLPQSVRLVAGRGVMRSRGWVASLSSRFGCCGCCRRRQRFTGAQNQVSGAVRFGKPVFFPHHGTILLFSVKVWMTPPLSGFCNYLRPVPGVRDLFIQATSTERADWNSPHTARILN